MLVRLIFDEIVYRAFALARSRATETSPFHGIVAPLDDLIGRRLFTTGWFERTQMAALKQAIEDPTFLASNVNADDVFIDVGSNIGLYSIAFCQNFKDVLAIEANPLTANILAANFALKNIKNAQIVVEGASDQNSNAKIYIPRNGNLGWGTLNLDHFDDDRLEYDIKTRKLDDIFSEYFPNRRAALIKIDVEGHETKVLLGAAQTIERDHPLIVFEALTRSELETNIAFLKARGYGRFVEFKRNVFGVQDILAIDVKVEPFKKAALICAVPDPG